MSRAESSYLVDTYGGIVISNSDIQWYELGNLGWSGEERKRECGNSLVCSCETCTDTLF